MRSDPILLMAFGFLVTACADRVDPSADGTLAISTSTVAGGYPDSDGYLLTVDGLDSIQLAATGTSHSSVTAGQHTLSLLGVAQHCSVAPDTSLNVDVPPGGSSLVAFIVSCPAAQITTKTIGSDVDGTYRLVVNGGDGGLVRSNDTVLTRLDFGSSTVSLTDLAPNCTPVGPSSHDVTVSDLSIVPIEFSVRCTATSGVIRVVVDPSGPAVSDMFEASLDGGPAFSVGLGVPSYINDVPAGDHVISLLGSASCSVVDPDSKPATMTTGALVPDTIRVHFIVTCVPPQGTTGTLKVTAPTTGPLPNMTRYTVCYWHTDPWGYSRLSDTTGTGACYGLEASFLGSIEPNGTLVADLTAGSSNPDYFWYYFSLTDVPANCSVQAPIPDPGPYYFSIPAGDTVHVEFAVTCSP